MGLIPLCIIGIETRLMHQHIKKNRKENLEWKMFPDGWDDCCRNYNKKNYDKNHNYQLNKNSYIKFLNSDMPTIEYVEGPVKIKFE